MIRALGACLLLAGAACMGMSSISELRERTRDLRYFASGLEAMERELSYSLAPLPELFCAAEKVTDGGVNAFFAQCSAESRILDGSAFSEAWMRKLKPAARRLKEEETELLRELGGILGRFDADSQRAALRRISDRLRCLCEEAEREARERGRVYMTLCMTAGAFLMILLI